MSTPKIKYDLQIKYGLEYGPEEEQALLEVLRQGAPTSGEACIQFEKDFAAYCGTGHARAVSDGTAALFLSLVALDIKPGDRILTTPMTWIATAAAGVTLGAEVDFVDIDPVTCNLDPAQWRPRSRRTPRRFSRCIFMANAATWTPSWRLPGATTSPWWRMPVMPSAPNKRMQVRQHLA